MKKWKEISRKTKTIIFSALGATCLLATAGATTAYAVVTTSNNSNTKLRDKDNQKPNKNPIGNKGFGEYENNIFSILKSAGCIPADYADLYYDKYENIDEMHITDAFNWNKPLSVNIRAQHRIEIFVDFFFAILGIGSNSFVKSNITKMNNIYHWNTLHSTKMNAFCNKVDNLIAPILVYHNFSIRRGFEIDNLFSLLENKTKINNSLKGRNINLFDYSKLSTFNKSEGFIKMLLDTSTSIILKLYEIINEKIGLNLNPFDSLNNKQENLTTLKFENKEELYLEYLKNKDDSPNDDSPNDDSTNNDSPNDDSTNNDSPNDDSTTEIEANKYTSSKNFSIDIEYYKKQDPSFRIMNNEINLGFRNKKPAFMDLEMTDTLLNRTKLASFGYQFMSNTGYDWLINRLYKLFFKKSVIKINEIQPTLDSILLFILRAFMVATIPLPPLGILFSSPLENIKAAIISGLMFLYRLYSVINYVGTAIDYYVRYYTNAASNAPDMIELIVAYFTKNNAINEIDAIISDFYGPKFLNINLVPVCEPDKNGNNEISESLSKGLNAWLTKLIIMIKSLLIPIFEGFDSINDNEGLMEILIYFFSVLNSHLITYFLRPYFQDLFSLIYIIVRLNIKLQLLIRKINPDLDKVILILFENIFWFAKVAISVFDVVKFFKKDSHNRPSNDINFKLEIEAFYYFFQKMITSLDKKIDLIDAVGNIMSSQIPVPEFQKFIAMFRKRLYALRDVIDEIYKRLNINKFSKPKLI